jgi:hypothetical protein
VLCKTFLPKLASKINCDKTRIYLFPVPYLSEIYLVETKLLFNSSNIANNDNFKVTEFKVYNHDILESLVIKLYSFLFIELLIISLIITKVKSIIFSRIHVVLLFISVFCLIAIQLFNLYGFQPIKTGYSEFSASIYFSSINLVDKETFIEVFNMNLLLDKSVILFSSILLISQLMILISFIKKLRKARIK